jgi:colanic acid biosynthesis glycosyl transferase WcaI
MGKAQALQAVLAAAALVAQQNKRVQFVFVGGGTEVSALEQQCASSNLENVRFVPRMPMEQVGQLLARADALLVHLRDDPLFAITIPSKTQAYLAVGQPIIMAVRGDAANLVRQAGAGLEAEPENPTSIAQAVLSLANMPLQERDAMGRQAMQYYRDHLSLQVGVSAFIKVFTQILSPNKRRRQG